MLNTQFLICELIDLGDGWLIKNCLVLLLFTPTKMS